MSEADSFFDTNVLLYLLSRDTAKADRAEVLLASGGIVSVQVLNEFASVALRKLAMTIRDIRVILSGGSATSASSNHWTLRPTSLVSTWPNVMDSQSMTALIVAAATRAGCSILYTEDLQEGQVIDQLTIRNPFAVP